MPTCWSSPAPLAGTASTSWSRARPGRSPIQIARLAEAFTQKYDDFFGLRVHDGRLEGAGTTDELLAFEVHASKAFGFGKGASFSQTRWRFR